MNNSPIGIIDSGIGGLSIWQEIARLLPNELTIYLGDQKNVPYGSRSAEEIYALAKRLVQYLFQQRVKLIVIACNVISVTSLERLREDFSNIHIIGTVPVVKTAVAKTKNKKIGILATKTTANSTYAKHLINTYASGMQVIIIGTDRLVPLVEQGKVEGDEVQAILKQELRPFITHGVDTVALSCTHFPFLEPAIQQVIGKQVQLLDSSGAVARQVQAVLKKENALASKNEQNRFLTTGNNQTVSQVASKLLQKKINFVEIVL